MNEYVKNAVKDLKTLISIPSVQAEPEKDMPFGKAVFDALDFFLKTAEEMGFKTVNYDNYIGEVDFGDGKDEIGILCHLDVVPAGDFDKWTYPPFSATEANGRIYGRGATDDKGPAIVCLHAMKALKDEGYVPNKKIRLILGCNEETGWKCIEHFNKVAKMPENGFSPDADFPVIYAEKGIMPLKFSFKKSKKLVSITGGERVNVVCDRCEAVTALDIPDPEKFGVQKIGEKKYLALGKSAHGSTPHLGDNAMLKMLNALRSIDAIDENAIDLLFNDRLGMTTLSDHSGRLTMSPDVITSDDKNVYISVDIRYPVTAFGDDILKKFQTVATVERLSHQLPLCADKNGELVQTLLGVYEEVTGVKAEPIAIGGGTYARAMKNAVAFGPETAGTDFAIHQPDEFASIENIELQYAVYKAAIAKLAK